MASLLCANMVDCFACRRRCFPLHVLSWPTVCLKIMMSVYSLNFFRLVDVVVVFREHLFRKE